MGSYSSTPIARLIGDATNSRLDCGGLEVAQVATFQVAVQTDIQIVRIVSTTSRVVSLNLVTVLPAAFASSTLRGGGGKVRTLSLVWARHRIMTPSTTYAARHGPKPPPMVGTQISDPGIESIITLPFWRHLTTPGSAAREAGWLQRLVSRRGSLLQVVLQ